MGMFSEMQDEAIENLRRLLWKDRERFWILQGRMRACNEESQKHDLSITEIDGWIEEIDQHIGKKK